MPQLGRIDTYFWDISEFKLKLEKEDQYASRNERYERMIRVSDTEWLNEKDIVEKLTWNRQQKGMFESKLKLLEQQLGGMDSAQYGDALSNANREIDSIRSSLSFKIGRFVTWLPRKIRGLFRKH